MREKFLLFLSINNFDFMFDQLIAKCIDTFRAGFEVFNQTIPEEMASVIDKACRARRTIFEDALITIYQEHFTEEDLDGIIAFHQGPLGRKLATFGPAVQSSMMATEESWVRETIQSADVDLQKIFAAAEPLVPQAELTSTAEPATEPPAAA